MPDNVISDEEFNKLPDAENDSAEVISEEEFEALPDADTSEQQVLSDEEFNKLPDAEEDRRRLESLAAGVTDTATMGFGDELYGGLAAAGEAVGLVDSERSIFDEDSFGAEYRAQRDKRREYEEEVQEAEPGYYTGGQIAGAAGMGAGIGTAGARSVVAQGAAEGGLYGLGSSEAELTEGDMEEYKEAGEDIVRGAGTGAAFTGASKIVGKGVRGLGKTGKKGFETVTGVTPKNKKDLARKGAAELLGVPEKNLDDAMVDSLRAKGLGRAKKETILGRIKKNIEKSSDPEIIQGLKKEEDLLRDADTGLINETIRASKDIDLMDIGALTTLGPGALAGKKVRDIAASRFRLHAPGIEEGAQRFKEGYEKLAGEVGGAYDTMAREGTIRMPSTRLAQSDLQDAYDTGDGQQYPGAPSVDEILNQVEGTKYQNVFDPENNNKNRVRHHLLMQKDSEYRKMMLRDEEE